jgi:hypothetical protein
MPCCLGGTPCLRVSVSCGWIHFDFAAGFTLDPPAGDKCRGPDDRAPHVSSLALESLESLGRRLASTRLASTPLT